MSAPKNDLIQVSYTNPDASSDLKLSLLVMQNTSSDEIEKNIYKNSRNYHDWLYAVDEHDKKAVLIGGGGSINNCIEEIRQLQNEGAIVFGLNGASKWARGHGISIDYQVIIDAKEESKELVDTGANAYLMASQCNPETLKRAKNPILLHLITENVEDFLPKERVKKGGYTLVGSRTTVGTTAMCIAYILGFRDLHLFGYDSSHTDGKSHGYSQPMNNNMPFVKMEWAGKTFDTSIAMKGQAERFPLFAKQLKELGCHIKLYGQGLLQTIYSTDYSHLSEREKYQLMWNLDTYRAYSPGENIAEFFLNEFHPGRGGLIIDYGCGTGRAGIVFKNKGHDVMLMDFADNCRDDEALDIPFIQHDLTAPCPIKSAYGFCTDVMEHIPTEDVDKVISNIMNASENVFFQISTIDDAFGETIDEPLHLTVKPHSWWKNKFESLGHKIIWEQEQAANALFYIQTGED